MGIRRRIHSDDGFTLAELMVILVIMAILMGIAVAAYVPASRAASSAACRHNQQVLEEGASLATCTLGVAAPDDITDLAPFVQDFPNVSTCPLDGAALTYDPATKQVICPNHS